jgi:bacillithiol system protein YtxJ
MSDSSSRADSETQRLTLRERFFPLHTPAQLDEFLARWPWTIVFKAGTSDKTFDAWLYVQRALEPRADVAVGFIRLPEDRPASDHVAQRTSIEHRSPQLILFADGAPRGHLDEFAIEPERLAPLLAEQLPASLGPRVRNPAVVTVDRYRRLLASYLDGSLPDPRFQWGYLDRLEKEARWRDDETFSLLNGLFENRSGREVHPAQLIAIEFQEQLAGRREPLPIRAQRLLDRLGTVSDPQ